LSLFALYNRSLRIKEQFESNTLRKQSQKNIANALFKLIAANEYVPDHGIKHLLAEKHTVPLDLKTFNMLANMVDRNVGQLRDLTPNDDLNRECDALAIKLQAALFRFSFYRLAAGMNSVDITPETEIQGVRTGSFSIKMIKFSAANERKNPLYFNLKPPGDQKSAGTIQVEILPKKAR